MENATITLAGRTFTVEPLTFDQLRRALPASVDLDKSLADGGLGASIALVRIALEGQISEAEMSGLRAPLAEILVAARTVGVVSGLLVEGEPIARAART